MLQLIAKHVAAGDNFALETTLSGRAYLQEIPRWQQLGYRVELLFLALPSAHAAKERVALRVSQGGHSIPDDVIERRFHKGWENFRICYKNLVDAWSLIDASDNDYKVLDWKEK